jgi:hypothetical protein
VIFNFDGATVILTQCKPVFLLQTHGLHVAVALVVSNKCCIHVANIFFGVMRVLPCCVHALIINDDTPGQWKFVAYKWFFVECA